jgi:hypothetical protein
VFSLLKKAFKNYRFGVNEDIKTAAVPEADQKVPCDGNPSTGVATACLLQGPWELHFNGLYSFTQKNPKMNFI